MLYNNGLPLLVVLINFNQSATTGVKLLLSASCHCLAPLARHKVSANTMIATNVSFDGQIVIEGWCDA